MSRYVAKHHHLDTYYAPGGLQTQLNEVSRLVEQLMRMNLSPPLRKLMIGTALYQIGHLKGGYKGQYRSQGVLEAARSKRSERIQLDHVHQRKHWILRLQSESVANVIDSAFCCVVTKSEHDELTERDRRESNSAIDGWDRYRKAEIVAFDMSGEKPVRAFQ